MKFRCFCTEKENVSSMKRHLTQMGKIFAGYLFEKVFASIIDQGVKKAHNGKLVQFGYGKTKLIQFGNRKNLDMQFSKAENENEQYEKKLSIGIHQKKYKSILQQIQPHSCQRGNYIYHIYNICMYLCNADDDMEKKEHLHTTGGNVNQQNPCGQQ